MCITKRRRRDLGYIMIKSKGAPLDTAWAIEDGADLSFILLQHLFIKDDTWSCDSSYRTDAKNIATQGSPSGCAQFSQC